MKIKQSELAAALFFWVIIAVVLLGVVGLLGFAWKGVVWCWS